MEDNERMIEFVGRMWMTERVKTLPCEGPSCPICDYLKKRGGGDNVPDPIEHERNRFSKMTQRQLQVRLNKITKMDKLLNFAQMATEFSHFELAAQAVRRFESAIGSELTSEWVEDLREFGYLPRRAGSIARRATRDATGVLRVGAQKTKAKAKKKQPKKKPFRKIRV